MSDVETQVICHQRRGERGLEKQQAQQRGSSPHRGLTGYRLLETAEYSQARSQVARDRDVAMMSVQRRHSVTPAHLGVLAHRGVQSGETGEVNTARLD